jgi:phosphomethylpyrimidine synthase
MARARAALDWDAQFALAMDPVKPVEYRKSSEPEHKDSCTMCGKMCAVRNMNRVLEGKDIQLDD